MALTPERKLKKTVIDLMRDPLFADMSGIFMLGSKQVVGNIPTACTNGRDELYGKAFVESLDMKELAFVVVHESYHKLLRQLTVWSKLWEENPRLANRAMDYVINLAIVKRDPSNSVVKVPQKDGKPMALLDKRFDNMNTKQVYDILKDEQKGGDVDLYVEAPQPHLMQKIRCKVQLEERLDMPVDLIVKIGRAHV